MRQQKGEETANFKKSTSTLSLDWHIREATVLDDFFPFILNQKFIQKTYKNGKKVIHLVLKI